MSPASQPTEQPETLTPRQQEILALLQAGKVNKEVARELGIGVGTVKQHLIAIFRKLNVKNRTMAVGKSVSSKAPTSQANTNIDDHLPLTDDISHDDSALERRPCALLVLSLPETTDAALLTTFQTLVQTIAQQRQATLIHRRQHVAELVFGLSLVHDLNPLFATATAYEIKQLLAQKHPQLATSLSGVVSAGMLVVSINRFGDWNEEVLAGTLIGKARKLAKITPSGHIVIDPIIQHLLNSHALDIDVSSASPMPFTTLNITLQPNKGELAGREKELTRIRQTLSLDSLTPPIIVLQGDSGMGKTQIAYALLNERNQERQTTAYFRCLPYQLNSFFTNDAAMGDVTHCMAWINAQEASHLWQHVRTIIIDDVHLLRREDMALLFFMLQQRGYAAVLTSRLSLDLPKNVNATFVSINHLSQTDMESIARQLSQHCPEETGTQHLPKAVQLAHGVPRFLYELLVECKPMLTLSLITTILARIDHLKLDRFLLRAIVSHQDRAYSPSTQRLTENPEQTLSSLALCCDKGILVKVDNDHYAFHHPMVKMVVQELFIKVPQALQQD